MIKEFTCQQCGITFSKKIKPSQNIPKYCSYSCSGTAKRKHYLKTFVCEYCGESFEYLPYAGLLIRKYCSKDCMSKGRSDPTKTYICQYCHKEFVDRVSSERLYCSATCRIKGEIDPSKKAKTHCKVCGKEFQFWTYRHSTCCSKKCASLLSNGVPKPNKRKPENFINRICQFCGNHFKIHKCQLEREGIRQGIYCSVVCRGNAQSLQKRGIGNPNYKGGTIASRGPNWGSQSRKARRRDKLTCQVCGKRGKEDHIKITVHHIFPYREFKDDWETANQLINLISLCYPCHAKVECGKMELSQDRQLAATAWFTSLIKSTVTFSVASE